MNFVNPGRTAGLLLIAALLVPLLTLILFAVRGNLADVFSQIGGAAGDRYVRTWSLSGWMIASLLSLAGFNLITTALRQAGERHFSSLALTGMTVMTGLLVLEATVHLAFGAWADEEFLRTGSQPALYAVFFQWSSVILQRVYVSVGYVGLMLYGLAILTSAWLPTWTGLLLLGWGGGMLIVLLLSRTTLPATLLLPGAVVGLA